MAKRRFPPTFGFLTLIQVFDGPERSLIRRRHQCLLQLLEQPLVRGIVAEPLLATADQRLVLGHARVIDVGRSGFAVSPPSRSSALTATVIFSPSPISITGSPSIFSVTGYAPETDYPLHRIVSPERGVPPHACDAGCSHGLQRLIVFSRDRHKRLRRLGEQKKPGSGEPYNHG
jgi:hypothetical protein